jgi:hypothetical protein
MLYETMIPVFTCTTARWLGRYVTEGKAVSLLKARIAVAALTEFRAHNAPGGECRLQAEASR